MRATEASLRNPHHNFADDAVSQLLHGVWCVGEVNSVMDGWNQLLRVYLLDQVAEYVQEASLLAAGQQPSVLVKEAHVSAFHVQQIGVWWIKLKQIRRRQEQYNKCM